MNRFELVKDIEVYKAIENNELKEYLQDWGYFEEIFNNETLSEELLRDLKFLFEFVIIEDFWRIVKKQNEINY